MVRVFKMTNLAAHSLVALFILGTMTAQGGWRQKTGQFSKKAFETTCKGIEHYYAWTLALVGTFNLACYNFSEEAHLKTAKILFSAQDAPSAVDTFVQQEVRKNLPNNQKTLHVLTATRKLPTPTREMATILTPLSMQNKHSSIILVHPYTENFLQSASEEDKQALQAMLAHECSHIRHDEMLYCGAARIASPFAVYCGCKFLKGTKVASPSLMRTLARIPKGLGKGLAAEFLYKLYSRAIEQRADDEVPNDQALLQAGGTVLQKQHEYSRAQLLDPQEGNVVLHSLNTQPVWNFFLSTHPTHRKRADKLLRRAQEIEQREQPRG